MSFDECRFILRALEVTLYKCGSTIISKFFIPCKFEYLWLSTKIDLSEESIPGAVKSIPSATDLLANVKEAVCAET